MTINDAVRNGNLVEAKKLLENNPTLVQALERFDSTPLHIAAEVGNKSMVEVLLAYKADINAKGSAWWTPLHEAASNGHKDIVEFLLANNANVYARTNDGKTPLSVAQDSNHKEVAEILQNYLKEITSLRSALWASIQVGDVKKVTPLLEEHPGLVTVREDWKEKTPLHLASNEGHKNVVKVLLTYNADINAKNHDGETPLWLAAEKGHKGVVEVLLANNADIKARDFYYERTPLHMAALWGHADVVEVLLANNADINARNEWGQTPLHSAVEGGHRNVVEILLANNANVNAKTNDGLMPLDYAVAMNKTAIASLLKKHIDAAKSFIEVEDHLVQMEENDIPAKCKIAFEFIENLKMNLDSEGDFHVIFEKDFSGFTESLNNMSKRYFENNYSIEDIFNVLKLHDLRNNDVQKLYLEILKMATKSAYKEYYKATSSLNDSMKLVHIRKGVRLFVRLYIYFLISTLHHYSADLRAKAAFELGEIRWNEDGAPIEALSDALCDEYPYVRSIAEIALAKIHNQSEINPREIKPLIDVLLRDKDPYARSTAEAALREINDPREIELLTDALRDKDPDVHSKAEAALEKIKGENSPQPPIPQQKWHKKSWWEFWK